MSLSDTQRSTEVTESRASGAQSKPALRLDRPFGVYVIILCNLFGAYSCLQFALPNLAMIVSLRYPLSYRAFLAAYLLAGAVNLVSLYGLWHLKRWGGIVALGAIAATVAMKGWLESINYDLDFNTKTEAIDSFTVAILLYSGFVIYALTPKFRGYFSRTTTGTFHSREFNRTRRTAGLEVCTLVALLIGFSWMISGWKFISYSTTYLAFLYIIVGILSFLIAVLYLALANALWTMRLSAINSAKIVLIIEAVLGLLTLFVILTDMGGGLGPSEIFQFSKIVILGLLLTYVRGEGVRCILV